MMPRAAKIDVSIFCAVVGDKMTKKARVITIHHKTSSQKSKILNPPNKQPQIKRNLVERAQIVIYFKRKKLKNKNLKKQIRVHIRAKRKEIWNSLN